jgi:uncharacterized protein YbjT (DUF2867 family)
VIDAAVDFHTMGQSSKTILVLGATGRQGGAVVRALLRASWDVRALVRDVDTEAARGLKASGVALVVGDMDDPISLRTAFADVHGAYAYQAYASDPKREVRQGIAVADAAKAARVRHFVYGSVGGAERGSGVPHFESKWRVERHIREIDLPTTIVRPVFFMENFLRQPMRAVLLALMRSNIPDSRPLQMISVDDIGRWVALALADPETCIGRAAEIAGDELTRAQIVTAMRRHGWSTSLPFPIPRFLFKPIPQDIRMMFAWFGTTGYAADIGSLERQGVGFTTFDRWLDSRTSF